MYLLGYLPKENRVYLIDKQHNIYSYNLLVSVLVYQSAIVRKDFDAAQAALKNIPENQMNKLAHFLESQDLKELALQVSRDPEHRFELALHCKKLHLAKEIILDSDSEHKWRQLGDSALNQVFDLKLAEECFIRAKDISSLLLIYTSLGDAEGLAKLAKLAEDNGNSNIAFISYLLSHRVEDCIKLLCSTGRVPEAAFMARTYLPSHTNRVLTLWKEDLSQVSEKAAESLASPEDTPDEFPDFKVGIEVEEWAKQVLEKDGLPAASNYPLFKDILSSNLIEEFKEGKLPTPGTESPYLSPPQLSSSTSSTNNSPVLQTTSLSQSSPQTTTTSIGAQADFLDD